MVERKDQLSRLDLDAVHKQPAGGVPRQLMNYQKGGSGSRKAEIGRRQRSEVAQVMVVRRILLKISKVYLVTDCWDSPGSEVNDLGE